MRGAVSDGRPYRDWVARIKISSQECPSLNLLANLKFVSWDVNDSDRVRREQGAANGEESDSFQSDGGSTEARVKNSDSRNSDRWPVPNRIFGMTRLE